MFGLISAFPSKAKLSTFAFGSLVFSSALAVNDPIRMESSRRLLTQDKHSTGRFSHASGLNTRRLGFLYEYPLSYYYYK